LVGRAGACRAQRAGRQIVPYGGGSRTTIRGLTARSLSDIAEPIHDGQQPSAMTVVVLMRLGAVGWDRQTAIGFCPDVSGSE